MKKQLLLIGIFTSLFYNLSYSQITMGSIEKKKEEEVFVEAPPYSDSENFIEYGSYYNPFVPEKERTSKSEFYNRYKGLQIYYPEYSNDYKKGYTLIFKVTDKIDLLTWTDIGNKYFTIQNIVDSFGNSGFFNKIQSPENKEYMDDYLLIELKDNSNGEIIYVVEPPYSVKFILVPYYEKMKKYIDGNIFVATKDFSGTKIPLSKTNCCLYVDKNTEWKGELTILKAKDLTPHDSTDETIEYVVILSNDKNTILMKLLYKGFSGETNLFNESFSSKEDAETQKQLTENEKKAELNKLIKKYGEKYGKLVYEKKLTIGMSKDMCSDIWGITLHRKTHTDKSGKVEVWDYPSVGKLYFKNDKLSDIIRY